MKQKKPDSQKQIKLIIARGEEINGIGEKGKEEYAQSIIL